MSSRVSAEKGACHKDPGEGQEEVVSVFEEMKEEGREEMRKGLISKVQDAYAIDIPIEKIAELCALTVERTKQILAKGRRPA